MDCPHCGAGLPDDARFCGVCGQQVPPKTEPELWPGETAPGPGSDVTAVMPPAEPEAPLRTLPPPSVPPDETAVYPPAAPRPRSLRYVIAGIAVLALAGGGAAAAYFAFRSSSSSSSRRTVTAEVTTTATAPATSTQPSAPGGTVTAPTNVTTTATTTASLQALRSYVDGLDTTLLDSANTRENLGLLIAQVSGNSIGAADAESQIDGIIAQRRSLLDSVRSGSVPAAFVRPRILLEQSIIRSLANDIGIRRWILDIAAGNTAAAHADQLQNLRLSHVASASKTAFLAEYNGLRRRLLGLAPLRVAY